MKNNKIAKATPQKLLTIVCAYFGLKRVSELAKPARPDLWRYPEVLEEARQIACWLLQRHCDLSLAELQVALKRLKWNSVFIRSAAEQAKRRLVQGDFAFCLAVENILAAFVCTK